MKDLNELFFKSVLRLLVRDLNLKVEPSVIAVLFTNNPAISLKLIALMMTKMLSYGNFILILAVCLCPYEDLYPWCTFT